MAKKQANKWSVKTGPEFANNFVYNGLKNIFERIQIKGVIVSTLDLSEEINFPIQKISNFQGVRKIQINTEVDPKEIIELMEKYPKIFFALSFRTK